MAKRDYYEVLGVGKSASADEIKKAFWLVSRLTIIEIFANMQFTAPHFASSEHRGAF